LEPARVRLASHVIASALPGCPICPVVADCPGWRPRGLQYRRKRAASSVSIGAKAGPSGAVAPSTCALVGEEPSAFSAASTLERWASKGVRTASFPTRTSKARLCLSPFQLSPSARQARRRDRPGGCQPCLRRSPYGNGLPSTCAQTGGICLRICVPIMYSEIRKSQEGSRLHNHRTGARARPAYGGVLRAVCSSDDRGRPAGHHRPDAGRPRRGRRGGSPILTTASRGRARQSTPAP
jgi:hypothetical protein